MGATSTTSSASVFRKPGNPVGYIAIVMALVTGVLHLVAATNAIQFSQTLGILFVLNGLGFLGGIGLYLSKYWRKELFIVAALYSLVTILALFPVQGWGVEAFYMQGEINPLAVITKAAEAVLVVCALYLYATDS
ncbi:uncharacterized protein NP_3050A [Natronomonas pharaonis DSM 2160]|uniref:Uncharacterized protein n=1 Tax=Natronomonas pharaonis (strain ATCC 35678 / DSM 2160 / CIP 103997 / JCM 8858 / NBRC 14720 / NCIMB 2260 / Gabara) TaxID=348780 RepID=A0A1U7EWY3_NATPD|nr:hypothetical protein [Natronomonas pharaonis]CAI49616.1 uncharacterized protein NP_3050A [Natronomonas pharaonis DSM 2160]